MGKIDLFEVRLEDPSRYYYPGEKLRGRVELRTSQDIKINYIEVKLIGRVKVEWRVSRTGNRGQRETSHYSGSDNHLNFPVIIVPRKSEPQVIAAGNYVYPFVIELPRILLGSTDVYDRRVYYMVQAQLNRSWALNKNSEQEFNVHSGFDLNVMPHLRSPVSVSDTKNIGLINSQSINLRFDIDKGGYAMGESIKFQITVDNRTDKELSDMTLQLVELEIMTSTTGSNKDNRREKQAMQFPRKVLPHSYDTWSGEYPVSTSLDISILTKVLKTTHFIEFRVKAGFWSFAKTLSIPIAIGTRRFIEPDHQGATKYPY